MFSRTVRSMTSVLPSSSSSSLDDSVSCAFLTIRKRPTDIIMIMIVVAVELGPSRQLEQLKWFMLILSVSEQLHSICVFCSLVGVS